MVDFFLSAVSNIFYIFFAFSLVIFIHEFGHYYVGKKCGIGVQEFSIGFGPKLLGFRDKSGVVWKICILPFGGFVKFEGDLDPSSLSSENNNFSKNTKSEVITMSTLEKKAITKIKAKLISYVS